jgi:hypothetical protein
MFKVREELVSMKMSRARDPRFARVVLIRRSAASTFSEIISNLLEI